MNRALFTSIKDDWETPPELFNELNNEFHFTVDLCANEFNHKCTKYYSCNNDGMLADLTNEIVFCNPPYGRCSTSKWIEKCATSKCISVMLIPARTDTKAFHKYIYNKAEIRFIKGRVKFLSNGKSVNSAPFLSMIVIFRNI